MNFQAYVINLEHATTRWEHMREQLEHSAIPYTRIEGVYGDLLVEPVVDYDEHRYQVRTGKETNKREIGCYFSHIKAMSVFLQSDLPYALILEDDVILPKNIIPLLTEVTTQGTDWDMLRLTSSRDGDFLPFSRLSDDYQLAYNLKVLKNTGAYFINRHAAECCVKGMLPMSLPYDVALDRDWDFGFKTACIIPFPISLEEEFPGQIPKARRIRFYRSTTFHLFHLRTLFERRQHRQRYFRQALARKNSSQ